MRNTKSVMTLYRALLLFMISFYDLSGTTLQPPTINCLDWVFVLWCMDTLFDSGSNWRKDKKNPWTLCHVLPTTPSCAVFEVSARRLVYNKV